MLTLNQFNLLYALYKHEIKTQRQLGGLVNLAVSSVNSNLKNLAAMGYIEEFKMTDKGTSILNHYKVDNAVIMAAGMATRFAPISYEMPKGLLKVKGEVLIERQIEQLKKAGIHEIIVVVGYMKEQFFYLEDKYDVKIVVNEAYYKCNNTSTLYLVRDKLKNTYICSSDNYFVHNVFTSHVYDSYYSCVYQAGSTDEYCVEAYKNKQIKHVTIGGKDSLIMLGHVYFSKNFSDKFAEILEREYTMPGVNQMLWEQLYMRHIKELVMYMQEYKPNEVFEFDTIDELQGFDNSFIENIDSKVIDNIIKVLKCSRRDIVNFIPIKKGLTNISFSFEVKEKKYVYRHPGERTETIINRYSEAFSQEKALALGLDETFIYMEPKEGWKISYYLENIVEFDYHNDKDVKQILTLIKKLHDSQIISKWNFDIMHECEKMLDLMQENQKSIFNDFEKLRNKMMQLYRQVEMDGIKKCLCHNDCYAPNFLTDGNKMFLIDWEYSGNCDPASDLGTFICCSDYKEQEIKEILNLYFGRKVTRLEYRHYIAYIAISGYYWFIWALYKESIGNIVGEYLYIWYKFAQKYSELALALYAKEKENM